MRRLVLTKIDKTVLQQVVSCRAELQRWRQDETERT